MKAMPPILGAVAIVLLIGGYVRAYLGTGSRESVSDPFGDTPHPTIVRTYQHKWSPTVFAPAAFVESFVIGLKVTLAVEPDYFEGL